MALKEVLFNCSMVILMLTLPAIVGAVLFYPYKSVSDRYHGKSVWLERSQNEPYFWSVTALDDTGLLRFVEGYEEEIKARILFHEIAVGIRTRKWVRENDEERRRLREEENSKRPPPILIEDH
jgi:hypothetical protein